jgi:hypothetical protein
MPPPRMAIDSYIVNKRHCVNQILAWPLLWGQSTKYEQEREDPVSLLAGCLSSIQGANNEIVSDSRLDSIGHLKYFSLVGNLSDCRRPKVAATDLRHVLPQKVGQGTNHVI